LYDVLHVFDRSHLAYTWFVILANNHIRFPPCAVVLAHFQSNEHTYNVHHVQQHFNDAKWFVHLLAAML
jgi:hypothetical protein